MTLAFPRSLVLTALFASTFACSSTEPGNQAPDVPLPEPDDWVVKVYKPIMDEAKEMTVDKFLAAYPAPEYAGKISYDPSDSPFLADIANYAGLTDKHNELLDKNGFVSDIHQKKPKGRPMSEATSRASMRSTKAYFVCGDFPPW